jgi:hypothetical protein
VEIRQLWFFVTVAEELHFGRATAREHIVQSALSQQIQRLERELGVSLLERTTHYVRLTSGGDVLGPGTTAASRSPRPDYTPDNAALLQHLPAGYDQMNCYHQNLEPPEVVALHCDPYSGRLEAAFFRYPDAATLQQSYDSDRRARQRLRRGTVRMHTVQRRRGRADHRMDLESAERSRGLLRLHPE